MAKPTRTGITLRLSPPYRAILATWAESLGQSEAEVLRLALAVLHATKLSRDVVDALLAPDEGAEAGGPWTCVLDDSERAILSHQAAHLGRSPSDVLRAALRGLEAISYTPEEIAALAARGRAVVAGVEAVRGNRKGKNPESL